MNIKLVKAKILQKALCGKLVKQSNNKQSSSILAETIKEDKKEGIRDKNSLQEILDIEKPFILPNGWKWTRLGNYCKLQDGFKTVNVDMPYLEVRYLRGKSKAKIMSSGKLGYEGELVILVDGENSGEVFQIPHDGYIGSTFKKLNINLVLNSKFTQLIIQKNKELYKNNKTGSAIPHLNKKMFANTVIALPPIEEQEQIVVKVDELFSLIDELDNNKQDLLQNISNSRSKILQVAMQGKLVEQIEDEESVSSLLDKIRKGELLSEVSNEERIFKIPTKWQWVKLKDICEKSKYGSSAKSKEIGEVPVIRMGNIQNGKIDWKKLVYTSDETEINKYDLVKGDLLFNRTNSPDLVGKTAIYDGEQTAIYAGYLIRVRTLEGINSEYINFFMNSQIAKDKCKAVKTDGVSQSNINAEKLGNFVIPLPPTKEQMRIVEKINTFMDYIDAIEQELSI